MSSMKFLLILFLFVVVAAANYCDEKLCSPGKKHVCCNHSNKFSSRCPKGVKLFNFDKKYIKLSEDERNKLRNATANGNVDGLPQASKMPTIKWDKELAYIAQCNVLDCLDDHDKCRNTYKDKKSGQNLYDGYGPCENINLDRLIPKMVKKFASESKLVNKNDINSLNPSGNYKHFTQLACERATRFGCAGHWFPKREGLCAFYLVCNWNAGNDPNMAVYTAGKTATGCANGRNPDFNGLCSV